MGAKKPVSLIVNKDIVSTGTVERDRAEIAAREQAAEKSFRAALQPRVRGIEWCSHLPYDAQAKYIARQIRNANATPSRIRHSALPQRQQMNLGRAPAVAVRCFESPTGVVQASAPRR